MKSTLKWITGVILLLAGLGSIGQGGIVSAIFYVLGGLICLPPTFKIIEERIKFPFQTWQKYAAVIGALVIGGIAMPKTDKIGTTTENSTNSTSQDAKPQTDAQNDGSTEPKTAEKSEAEKLTEQLQREIESFEKPFDNSTYRGSKDAVQIEVVLFGVWAEIINNGEASSNPEDQKLAKNLKEKVVARQVKEFPQMRKEIAKVMKEKLWEENIEVKCFGNGNSTLDFVGGSFASNKIIKQTQETLSEMLNMYRFKRTQYRWIPSADEYTYYSIESPKDSELVNF